MITVLSFRKSDGRTETISIQSNGINLATMIQDAITRLVDTQQEVRSESRRTWAPDV